ncbi:CocE/NonD family hydrolase [Patulibacter sp.]|uniref:CocE/NonD family hydrolase n=1 Tax=Patulibacter sp. TaxID=1912859 RepID=UPI00271C09BB|nr:CocE/NonD family hydrolase [Patulibacter sp.]MDO9408535.1 CocE/NonD family hydrolase [Patulibacter sp.]
MPARSRPSRPSRPAARTRGRRTPALLATACALLLAPAGTASAADLPVPASVVEGATTTADGYSVRPLTFEVRVGDAVPQTCRIEAEIYRPAGASASAPAPAILTTNGFGGDVSTQRVNAIGFARKGYVVLNYSGLGWGGSGCKITLDDPEHDGQAASALVSYLGGAKVPGASAPVDVVRRDATAHDGTTRAADPRVGMVGGSYGGQVQFAAAGVDPRIDALIPVITWNDLRYSLAPNDAGLTSGVQSGAVGSLKTLWSVGFFALGLADGAQGLSVDPGQRTLLCPGFPTELCAAAATTVVEGYPTAGLAAMLRRSSVADYVGRIRVPTLLVQGQQDSLFNLRESVATYDALKAQGTPVKLMWRNEGHSGGKVAGEGDQTLRTGAPVTDAWQDWFAHWLKDDPKVPSLDFSYYRAWAHRDGDQTGAYARSASFPPAGTPTRLELSGDGTLQPSGGAVQAGTPAFGTTAAGLPTGYTTFALSQLGYQPVDLPGTSTSFVSAPLAADTDVVGLPSVRLRITPGLSGVTDAVLGDLGRAFAYVRLEDVAPDGSAFLPGEQIASVRVPADGRATTVGLPGVVHRFAKGHRLRLVVAGGDLAHRGNLVPTPLSVKIDPSDPSPLQLPVVPDADQAPLVRAAAPAPGARPTRLRVSRLSLTRRRVSVRSSAAATLRVTIARRVVRRVRSGPKVVRRSVWRTVRRPVLRATRPGTVRRTVRLALGRYRVTARATSPGMPSSRTLRRVRTLR